MKQGTTHQVIYCDLESLGQIVADLARAGLAFEASYSHAEEAWEIRILGY